MYDKLEQLDEEQFANEIDNSSIISYNNLYDNLATTNLYKLKRVRQVGVNEDNIPIKKNVVIKAYASGNTGTFIVNAVSGYTSKCKVGSSDEKLFYSVAICTGEGRNSQPINLYYDSPEQYEEHYMTTVHPDVKYRWHQKHKCYLSLLTS
jgi:hypothetical protein